MNCRKILRKRHVDVHDGDNLSTPEQIRQSDIFQWEEIVAWAAGKTHKFNVKIVRNIRWRASGKKNLQLVIIRPLAYRLTKKSKLLYRNPVEKLHAFIAAIYSVILLADYQSSKNMGGHQLPNAKWYKKERRRRHTTGDILNVIGSQLWGYVNLTSMPAEKPVQTYENINAQLIGTNFSYTYGQNLTNDSPLSEIRPFESTLKLRSPKFWEMVLFANLTYEAEQTRVDLMLSENTTPAWYKADIGIRYKLDHLNISLTIENITNQLYYKHLSYLRNPFASGVDVFEPGRNIYLSFTYSI